MEYFAEARYPEQVWEIEVPISSHIFESDNDINSLVNEFHKTHEDLFAINDPESGIEIVGWTASVKCRLRDTEGGSLVTVNTQDTIEKEREAYFVNQGFLPSKVKRFESLQIGEAVVGPAIIESPFTTVVIDPGAKAYRKVSGSLSIDPGVSYE